MQKKIKKPLLVPQRWNFQCGQKKNPSTIFNTMQCNKALIKWVQLLHKQETRECIGNYHHDKAHRLLPTESICGALAARLRHRSRPQQLELPWVFPPGLPWRLSEASQKPESLPLSKNTPLIRFFTLDAWQPLQPKQMELFRQELNNGKAWWILIIFLENM